MAWFWFGLILIFAVVEVLVPKMISAWLAVAAFLTAVLSLIFSDMAIGWQALIFAVLSAALIVATRPLSKKILNRTDKQRTNLALIVGHDAIVTEEIDNILGKGAVKINGLEWSARTPDGSVIECGEVVKILEIQGNKALVKKEGEM